MLKVNVVPQADVVDDPVQIKLTQSLLGDGGIQARCSETVLVRPEFQMRPIRYGRYLMGLVVASSAVMASAASVWARRRASISRACRWQTMASIFSVPLQSGRGRGSSVIDGIAGLGHDGRRTS